MREFNMLPEKSVPLAVEHAPPQSSKYDIVRVLSLGFNRDRALHEIQRGHLAHVFGSFGYEVRSVEMDGEGAEGALRVAAALEYESFAHGSDDSAAGVARAGGASFGSQAALEFKRLYEQVESSQRVLIIVCYVGHGVVLRTDTEAGPLELYGVATAVPGEDWIGIPLTAFQRHARGAATNVDTLFIFETCFGGHDGLGRRTAERPLVGTLAANDGTHTIWSCGCDAFSARLAGTLARNAKYGVDVWELWALTRDVTLPHAPGYYFSDHTQIDYDQWTDEQDANYVHLSIRLLPLRGSKAWHSEQNCLPLGPLPDAVVPRVALEPAHEHLLASWGVEERRLLLKLARESAYWGDLDSLESLGRDFHRHCIVSASLQGETYAEREIADLELVLRLLQS